MAARILLVEDERPIVDAVTFALKREGHTPIVARDGATGLSLARTEQPDLVLLDLMLPGLDGLAVCRTLRRESRVPIIMLTAKAEEIDKVVGFEVGADDYVTKPFSMRELLARVKAVLSRAAASRVEPEDEVLRSGDLIIHRAEHEVRLRGDLVRLAPKEFDLLSEFVRSRGRALSRDHLLERVWGDDHYDTHTIDVHVRWLREKIETDPGKPERLITVRGVGYKFVG